MNFSKTYRRMNEPVGPSPDLIRKTLSHPDRHRLPLRQGWRRPLPRRQCCWPPQPWRSGRRRDMRFYTGLPPP